MQRIFAQISPKKQPPKNGFSSFWACLFQFKAHQRPDLPKFTPNSQKNYKKMTSKNVCTLILGAIFKNQST